MFNVVTAFHVLRTSSPIAGGGQPRLDHREDNRGSKWEPGAAKGSSQGCNPFLRPLPWKMGIQEFLKFPQPFLFNVAKQSPNRSLIAEIA